VPVTERLAFRNGELDSSELRAAINELGMRVSEKNLRALIVHLKGSYAHGVSFDGFRSAPRDPAHPRQPAPLSTYPTPAQGRAAAPSVRAARRGPRDAIPGQPRPPVGPDRTPSARVHLPGCTRLPRRERVTAGRK